MWDETHEGVRELGHFKLGPTLYHPGTLHIAPFPMPFIIMEEVPNLAPGFELVTSRVLGEA